MKPQPSQAFTIPIGDHSLRIPAGALVPDSTFWNAAIEADRLAREGYGEISRREVERLQAFFREPPLPDTGEGLISQWFVARTATRREAVAIRGLGEQGFVTFLPMETRWGIGARLSGRVEVSRPLIPGYLFVLASPHQLRQILDTEGVHAFVGYYDDEGISRAMPIPLAAIIEIQADERAGVYDRTRLNKPSYRPKKGDMVKATAGPWLGFIGKILSTPKKDRAHVMIQGQFGRGMTIDVKNLAAA